MDQDQQNSQSDSEFRSGYVAICGYPNAGKSTLLNQILKFRLGIVTPKPQTTRRKTLGIHSSDSCQIIFIDTPGILDPSYDLQTAMMKQVDDSLNDADLLLYLVDLTRPAMAPGVAALSHRKPVIVLLNKADTLTRQEDSLATIEELKAEGKFLDFFSVSALKGRGVDQLLGKLEQLMPVGPPLYPLDQLTEHPERFFVGELIREAIFKLFREEVPYSTEVEIDDFREKRKGKDVIEATIYVESDSQKAILIGKGGSAIKRLGQSAREAVEDFLDREVYLGLHVKVMPRWRRDARALKRFGY